MLTYQLPLMPGTDRPNDSLDARVNRPRVMVRISPPPPALSGYVTFSYIVETDGPVSDFLYPEWGNVRFNLRGDMVAELPGLYEPGLQLATLYGPTDRAAKITATSGRIAGFGFTPIGWMRFIGEAAEPMANRIRPLRYELGISADEFRRRLITAVDDEHVFDLIDSILIQALDKAPAVPAKLLQLDEALRSDPANVHEFANRAMMSYRMLQRRCEQLFGFTPKRLLRRQRFLNVLGQVRMNPDARFLQLLDEQYFDQSHFIRDFRAFIGTTPRRYLKMPRDIFRIAAAEQASRGITLSFRLPPQPDG